MDFMIIIKTPLLDLNTIIAYKTIKLSNGLLFTYPKSQYHKNHHNNGKNYTNEQITTIIETYLNNGLTGKHFLDELSQKIQRKKGNISRFARQYLGLSNNKRIHNIDSRKRKNCIVCNELLQIGTKRQTCGNECYSKILSIKSKEFYPNSLIGLKKFWEINSHPRGMLGKKHSEEACKKMGKSRMGKKVPKEQIIRMMKTRYANGWRPPTVNRSWKAGKSEDLGDIYFRSAWERNYARYLNYLIQKNELQKWEFEKDVFWFEGIKRGVVSYKPDFKVFKMNGEIEYHEVKGWMDKKSQTKLKRMKNYYPKIKVILIDAPVYKSIAKYGKVFSQYW